MSIVINTTLSGTSTNSYVTLAEFSTYLSERLWTTSITEDDEERKKSLVSSFRRLNQEKYYGYKTVSTQKGAFPRSGLDELDGIDSNGLIPEDIKEAQMETAIFMLSNDITRKKADIGGIKGLKVGSIALDYIEDNSPSVADYNDLPTYIKTLLSEFSKSISLGGTVRIGR